MTDYAALEKRLREIGEHEAADAIAALTRELEALSAAGRDLLTVVNAGCGRGDYWHERKAMDAALKSLSRAAAVEDSQL